MREERGIITGDVIVYEHFELWGAVSGTVKVIGGGKLYVRGKIYGDLLVEKGGRCHVYGAVSGNIIVHRGGKCIHSGIVGGNAVNHGGRLWVEQSAKVMGQIEKHGGDTVVEDASHRRFFLGRE